MSRKSQKLDLKLNLSLLPSTSRRLVADDQASPHGCMSSPSSGLSSETDMGLKSPVTPEATSSMVLAGCPRCLMYVMLSEDDLKCPRCSSTVLLDFFHGTNTTTSSSKINKRGNKKTRMS